MNSQSAAVFEFGEFRLDTAEQVLRRNGVVVSLTPKAVNVLEMLLRRSGSVLSRSEMIETLWPDTFVEEANLTVTISMLRKALGEDGENYIRTVPKRGYTFAAPVREVTHQLTRVSVKIEESGTYLVSESVPTTAVAVPVSTPISIADALTNNKRRRRKQLILAAALTGVLAIGAIAAALISRSTPDKERTAAFVGMQISRLSDTGNIREVTISPDGNRIAFVSIQSGLDDLRIKNLQTGEQFLLLEAQDQLCWGLRFAHDGQNLYYITTQPNSTISVLYRIDLKGGHPHKIVVNIDAPIALSPDGSQIAFVRSFPGKHYDALVVANNDGTAEQELATLHHPQKFSFSGPAWSPAGKVIAIGTSHDNGATLSVSGINVSGGEMRALIKNSWNALRGLAWTDDGRNVVFSAGTKESPPSQLWRLNVGSGEVQRITNDTNQYEGVHLTKDGNKIITMQVGEVINLWLHDASTSLAPRKLTTGIREGEGGLVSLPSGQIVYTLDENRQLNLWTINRDGSEAAQLTREGAGYPTTTSDGKFLVYGSLRKGVRHLYRLDLATREELQLTNGLGENYPSCSPDGRWVIYTSLAGERNTLWRVSIDGGPPQQLTRGSIIIKPVVSPDGKWIACAYRRNEADKWKIAILPFDGGEPEQILPITRPYNQVLRWAADSKALFYVEHKRGIGNIWKQSLDQPSQPLQITEFTEDEIFYYDTLGAPDGFVLSRGRILRDIVMITNP